MSTFCLSCSSGNVRSVRNKLIRMQIDIRLGMMFACCDAFLWALMDWSQRLNKLTNVYWLQHPADLINLYLVFVKSEALTRTDKYIAHFSTVQMLFQNFPSDMEFAFKTECLVFFAKLFKGFGSSQDDPRRMSAVFSSVNWFLVRNGLDVFSHLPRFHSGSSPVFNLNICAMLEESHSRATLFSPTWLLLST